MRKLLAPIRRIFGAWEEFKRLSSAIPDLLTNTERLRRHIDSEQQRNDQITKHMLAMAYILARKAARHQPPDTTPWPRLPPVGLALDEAFADLEKRVPGAYAQWRELLTVNSNAYEGFPLHSCSVPGHPSGSYFQKFAYPYLQGRVLDIGCGPQPVPLYLLDYPLDLIYGIDPISSPDCHPFNFANGVGEHLPWPDHSFDVVISGTSIDHVLLLDRTYSEIRRVLIPGGHFLVWVTFMAEAPPYDPTDPDIRPVDAYHLFHFTRETFESSILPYFKIESSCRVQVEIDHYFYALKPREQPTT
ncbi:hypothetical protein MTBLM5_30018 [Magnetospirillum sp. LM-5]|uniref:class I SAM-dependent methyltransferase n=1 Tax=Magnetospirillum sp. LM-5 TaxID=2681466 RepID=UPI001382A5AB|nr:class I SAM-dependent methyltransferase [Magnetospirillum sp. LM-5]CAA7619095.1 hypothetical protein MTBLM5_30018 [Magnetospirillum sp. LM-5]